MKACLTFIKALLLILTVFTTEAKQYPNENQKKADYLYQITKFVDWPYLKKTNSPINLCIYGKDPFRGALDAIHLRKVNNRELQVSYIKQEFEIAHCSILFIQEKLPHNFVQKHYSLLTRNFILTIGEQKNFAQNGGIIQFVFKDKNLAIEINLQAAADSKITINANLIEIANKVFQNRKS
jgi:hypothetical protein